MCHHRSYTFYYMSPARGICADCKADRAKAQLNNAISSHHNGFRSQSSPSLYRVWHRVQISVYVHGRSLLSASSEWAQLPRENRHFFVKTLTHFWPVLSDSVLSARSVEPQREVKKTEELRAVSNILVGCHGTVWSFHYLPQHLCINGCRRLVFWEQRLLFPVSSSLLLWSESFFNKSPGILCWVHTVRFLPQFGQLRQISRFLSS